MSKEEVAQLVRERLQAFHPGGVTISVVAEKMHERDGCWRIPVRPDTEPPRAFEYYDALAEVEAQLSEQENLDVWLVPTTPDEEPQGTSASGSSAR
jgi:hypothetical protein